MSFPLSALVLLLAHPVAENVYDRTIVVRVAPGAVVIDYVLEVDTLTARNDVPSLVTPEERGRIFTAEQTQAAFARASAPVIAHNLLLRIDDETVAFTCTHKTHKLLDHLRCEYRFEAKLPLKSGKAKRFTFKEVNYEDERGEIRMTVEYDPSLKVSKAVQPADHLKKLPASALSPKELRTAESNIEQIAERTTETPPPSTTDETNSEPPPRELHDLLFETELGLWALLGLAALLGAAHALTPGHGKTLVAAYLVGQRGTAWHAVLLGIVTAMTHTGAVLLVAAVLPFLFPDVKPSHMQRALGFIGGLMIASLGFWLLNRRLAGKADHFHLPGVGHHHHHHHDEAPQEPLKLGGLVLLGISGGIVPCGEALALFLLAIRWERLDLALPLLVAFSAGLAFVLVVIGLGVVWTQRFTASHFKSGRLERVARLLPLVSAVLITAAGLWLCWDSVHGN